MNITALLVMSPRMMPTTTLMTPRMTRKIPMNFVLDMVKTPSPVEFRGARYSAQYCMRMVATSARLALPCGAR